MRSLLFTLSLSLLAAPAVAFDFGGALKKAAEIGTAVQGDSSQSPATAANAPAAGTQPAQESTAQTLLSAFDSTSEQEEITIGRQIAGNLLGAAPLVADDNLQRYVNKIGRWVASQSPRPDLAWHFGVIDSPDINAFAAPGGFIFLTAGLYRLLKNEAELAGVLGHEIGHVVRQHHLKILQQSKMVDLGSRLLVKQVSGDGSAAAQKLIGSGAEVVARSLDKGAEFEADRLGVVYAARAGYTPFALPSVLQQIGHAGSDTNSVALLFKTHPHPDDRLLKLGAAMGNRFDSMGGKELAERLPPLPAPAPAATPAAGK